MAASKPLRLLPLPPANPSDEEREIIGSVVTRAIGGLCGVHPWQITRKARLGTKSEFLARALTAYVLATQYGWSRTVTAKYMNRRHSNVSLVIKKMAYHLDNDEREAWLCEVCEYVEAMRVLEASNPFKAGI